MRNPVCVLPSRSGLMARHDHTISSLLEKHVAIVCTALCCLAMLGAYLVFQTYLPPAYSISENSASQHSTIAAGEKQYPADVTSADASLYPVTTMPVNSSVISIGNTSARNTSIKETVPPLLAPVYKVMHGAEAVWQIPLEPRAAVFYAHGCTHKATHFWDTHPDCPKCFGLPEDRALVLAALEHQYAVLAVSSSNVCWDVQWPPSQSKDVQVVVKIIDAWRNENKLGALPLYALGASSGGYLVSVLAHAIPFHALAIVIASGVSVAFTTPLESGAKYPPSLFVHMPKDEGTGVGVQKAVEELRHLQVSTAELSCWEVPITEHYFSDRIPRMSKQISEELHRAFIETGDVTVDGFLKQDGRRMSWYRHIANRPALKNYTQLIIDNEMAIEEELNLAYAYHEMTSLKSSAIFDWFDGVCTIFNRVEPQRCESYN